MDTQSGVICNNVIKELLCRIIDSGLASGNGIIIGREGKKTVSNIWDTQIKI